jgi:muramoyltetrapeptide carboxypeptidase
LENAFKDNQTDAILCVRGGYGALRIIDKIDYNIIKNNPKIFCGYSDITVLSAIILKKTGLITFSSPMPKGDFQPEEINEYTEKQFFKTLTNDKITVSAQNLKTYKSGNAKGIIIGGNLASVASLCGTDFIPDDKFIFFAEDLNEPVYKIDKYFRQLLNIKKFKKNISAIILGDFLDSEPKEQLD